MQEAVRSARQSAKRWMLALLLGTPLFIAFGDSRASGQSSAIEPMFISLEGAPSIGDEGASIAIVEFVDYECPYCGDHAKKTLPRILTDYIKTGKVRYFLKDLPIEKLHPQAFKAAEAARCSGGQGKYWEMHDLLFRDQLLTDYEFAAHAFGLGLDVSKFRLCMEAGQYADQIRKDLQESTQVKIEGTPTFFIGNTAKEAAGMIAVTKVYGIQSYGVFQGALDQMLLSPLRQEGETGFEAQKTPVRACISPRSGRGLMKDFTARIVQMTLQGLRSVGFGEPDA